MKTSLSYLFLALIFLFTSDIVQAQYRENDELHEGHQKYDDPERRSPNRSAEIDFGSGHATIEWSAPSVRDRQLYGGLSPDGNIWRSGANEATVIHFDDDVLVEGNALAAGSYALFTSGGPDEWTFIFNAVSQQWGAFSQNADEDVLRINVTPGEEDFREELRFAFEDTGDRTTKVLLSWGTIAVELNVEVAAED
ncbi:MAG: DUF2911 domain-containing protein [Bacteroidetes bacterium]|nr:DUF2911 domain-containing protein [Bacteroidota bacterium]